MKDRAVSGNPQRADYRMQLVLLLLLLPRLPHAQVTPSAFAGTGTAEAINRTNSLFNATAGTPESSSSPEPPEIEPTPSEAPEDDWTPAETYLASGDPSVLELGECSRAYSPPELSGPLPESFYAPLQPAMNALANTANFLNMIFQASDLRESTVREDMEWYHALVRALLEADLLIGHALLTFDADPAAQVPSLVLRASRNLAPKVQSILLQDLSRAWKSLHPPAPAPDDSWFSGFRFNEPMAALSKRVLLNDLTTLDTPKWGQGDSYVTNRSGVRWGNAPFLECKGGRFLPRWMLTLSTSFYGLKPDLTPEFRGVIRVDVNIQGFDVDQCAKGPGWFTNQHQCNRTSMECVPRPGGGFRLGQYCCRCKMGYYSPTTDTGSRNGANATGSGAGGSNICYPLMPVCLPCWPGCKSCEDGSPCLVQQNRFLRVWMMVIQGFFMILVFLSMLAAYQHRQSKRIRASGLILLETILFGALLLYFPVFILYFKPSTFRCILLRWMRMLGFSIVYGTVTLKLYRVLRVFLSRTAQRVPYMSSIHLLRMLGVMLVTVIWFLCAWTVCVLQNRERNIPVFVTSTTSDGQGFLSCYVDRWDDMMAVAELLLLCWGSSLCNAVKPVPSAFHEPRYMGFAVHNELLISSMFHLLRFFLPSLHPDWTLLLYFTHTHITISVTLALLFVPKFLHVSRPKREEIAAEVYEDEVDLRRNGSYFNNSFCSAYSGNSLDPDDIRDELKKLYSQLEVNKTKKMTSNNPHLSKTRGSRCLSIIKSIAAPLSRQCSGSREGRSVHYTETSRRGSAISINYRDSSGSVHKSQSDHDHVVEGNPVVERTPSLRDSMLKAITKRNSQRSMTDSLDIPPGVPKSLSAQNLTIDNNLLHPDHYKIQKSLSLKSTHSLVDIVPPPKVDIPQNRTGSLVTKSRPEANINYQTTGAIQASQSIDKGDVCPWDMGDDMNQKIVTNASSPGEDAKSVDLGAQLICPWEYVPPPPPPKPVESEAPPPQAPAPASAPVSPLPKIALPKARGLSLKTTTQKWLSVKAFSLDVKPKEKPKEGGANVKDDSISQKSHEGVTRERTASTTSKSPTPSRNPSVEKGWLQRKSITSTDGKPLLTKQNAIRRLSSTDSSDRSPRPHTASRQNSNHSNASFGGTTSRTPSTHRIGSGRLAPAVSISQANVCPWDAPPSPSGKANVCPWEVEETEERAGVCPWESQDANTVKRQESGRADLCPWDTQDIPAASTIPVSKELLQQRKQSLHAATDVCPWESGEAKQLSVKQDSVAANVCPWEVEGSEAIYQNVNPSETKGSQMAHLRQETVQSNVSTQQPGKSADSCPWEFPEPPKIVTDVCPWEEAEPSIESTIHGSTTIKVDICPWDISAPTADNDIPRVNICPWDTEQPDKTVVPQIVSIALEQTKGQDSGVKADVCPWETGEPAPEKMSASRSTDTIKIQDTKENVCPWETGEPEPAKMAASRSTDTIKTQDTAKENVCPWETGEPEPAKMAASRSTDTIKSQDTAKENVCPWETGEPEPAKMAASRSTDTLKMQDTAKGDVCPWETGEPEPEKANICPWETGEPEPAKMAASRSTDTLKMQDTAKGDVCPWETGEPEPAKMAASRSTDTLKMQDTAKGDVCPWETGEPEPKKMPTSRSTDTIKMQDTAKANVCPWETGEPEPEKANICPWETAEPETIKKPDVCPWETDEPKAATMQPGPREDACPWETAETKSLKKQDGAQANVCPWEAEEPKSLKKQDGASANVCPWEAEEPNTLKMQDGTSPGHQEDGTKANVCPWESEAAPNSTESKTDVPNGGKDEVAGTQQQRLSTEEVFVPVDSMPMQHDEESNGNLPLGRRDALCPWGLQRSRSGSFTDTSDVFTWEPENIPEEEEDDADAECAGEAFIFPADL